MQSLNTTLHSLESVLFGMGNLKFELVCDKVIVHVHDVCMCVGVCTCVVNKKLQA